MTIFQYLAGKLNLHSINYYEMTHMVAAAMVHFICGLKFIYYVHQNGHCTSVITQNF